MGHHQLDSLDEQILKLIAGNARIPFLEVARACNVSGAAIHQRIQKLTNLGILKGSEYVIDPEKIQDSETFSPVVFTDLYVNGTQMNPQMEDSPLKQSLAYSDEITLKYFQNSFLIDFSTFDYSMANDAKYIYKLIPYDKDWGVPSSLNFAAYKNLLPGTYQLHVKASSASGVWGEDETVLQIVITPPFWKTGWAFAIYIMLICMAPDRHLRHHGRPQRYPRCGPRDGYALSERGCGGKAGADGAENDAETRLGGLAGAQADVRQRPAGHRTYRHCAEG